MTDSSYALIIRHPSPVYKGTESSHRHVHHIHHDRAKHKEANRKQVGEERVLVEFLKEDAIDLSSFADVTPMSPCGNPILKGFLGFLNLKGYIHLGFITRSTKVACPQLNEGVYLIEDVIFFCLNNDKFDGWIDRHDEDLRNPVTDESEATTNGFPGASIRRFLSLGHFYYSPDYDITVNLQERGISASSRHLNNIDLAYFRRFAWNTYLISSVLEFREVLSPFEREQFEKTGFLTVITRGYAKSVNIQLLGNEKALMTLISKQSCRKSGALFGELGCDDEGEVPNYVESEIIISSDNFIFSYVIIRGNVPSFWELESNFSKSNMIMTKKNKKLKLTRSFEVSSHAFARHFDTLGKHFGDIHIVNSLSQDPKTYKGQLNKIFHDHYEDYQSKDSQAQEPLLEANPSRAMSYNLRVTMTSLPISHASIKKTGYTAAPENDILNPLVRYMGEFGAMFYDIPRNIFVGKQLGVFRVNSFDCLTKANFISKVISQEVIELAMRDMLIEINHDMLLQHAELWHENDKVLKKLVMIYPTSISLINSSSKKKSIKQHLTKKYTDVMRDPQFNENSMLKLLGRLKDQSGVIVFNPVHQYLSTELKKRAPEFSQKKEIKIFATTFNVNGIVPSEGDIKNLIYPTKHEFEQDHDIVFIGFQEIVELTPGKVISAKSDNFLAWERIIKQVLESNAPHNDTYVSVWGWQMGGIALLLFAKESKVTYISNIEGSIKKTGLGGMSANKGGIGVSFDYSKTLVCFVCSHLAAGFSNVDERHQNYKTISKGIRFLRHRKIRDHDAVIWLGDFNFRINLPLDHVKLLIKTKDYQKLFESDQLNIQMANGESFPFYDEMEITFPPTYKFDNLSKVYDTSEKQRVPAWTDRILSLSKQNILKQQVYDCEEDIIFLDHRPVYSMFVASVEVINEKLKKEVRDEIYESYKNEVGDMNFLLTASDVSSYVKDADNAGMPPPSSDTAKWWLDSGAAAKIQIPEFDNVDNEQPNMVLNPRTPTNPFATTEEPEIIMLSSVQQEG